VNCGSIWVKRRVHIMTKHEEIIKLKDDISKRKEIADNRAKALYGEVSKVEKTLETKIQEFNELFINDICSYIITIAENIEREDIFKFDGYHITRGQGKAIMYISTLENENYIINYEEGEFSLEFDFEDRKMENEKNRIIDELNIILHYY
jgi:hypothetical protein